MYPRLCYSTSASGPSKQLKQIIQIENNIVKNRNWPEANQLAIYKRGQGFELGATEKQIQ